MKPAIELRSGPSLSTEEIAKLLGVSEADTSTRLDAGELIGYHLSTMEGLATQLGRLIRS